VSSIDGVIKRLKDLSITIWSKLEFNGRAITQPVSRRIPTAAAWVRAHFSYVGFFVNKVPFGEVFFEYFGFPCQFSFYRLLRIHHHLSSGAGTIDQLVADVPSGLSLTLHPKKLKKKKTRIFDTWKKE
jgi:hypothetical protein